MKYKIESSKSLNQSEKIINDYVANGWKLHTFTTSYEGSLFVMVFEK